MEPTQFGEAEVIEINVKNQNISRLKKDAVKNMSQLKFLVFYGCEIESIEPGAFRNVQQLAQLMISNGKLTEIPTGVFNGLSLERLRIHNNFIDVVGDRAFANMSKLRYLHASWNKIEYYGREWFLDSPQLEHIELQRNAIRIIPRKAFFYNSKLKKIFLDYNNIDTIQQNAFENLQHLEYLGLSHNRIKVIPGNAFPNGLSIKSLLLNANKLNYLENEILRQLSVNYLAVNGNPWKCPCLERIRFWIYVNNGSLSQSEDCGGPSAPICVVSNSYANTCLEIQDEQATALFFDELKKLQYVGEHCFRLD